MAAPVTCADSSRTNEKIGFEIKLAQALAGNEKKRRDKSLKKLEKWIMARTQSKTKPFSKDEMSKVWKGLHYCMWMSDKPLIQEDLAERISGLVHLFKIPEMMITWLSVFLETEAREWNGIDQFRLDKFMMLIRFVLRQSLGYMKRLEWPENQIKLWLETVFQNVVDLESRAPDGMKMHIVDIIFYELTLVGADDFLQAVWRSVVNWLGVIGPCRELTIYKTVFQYLPFLWRKNRIVKLISGPDRSSDNPRLCPEEDTNFISVFQLTPKKIGLFLHPFCQLLSCTKSACVSKRLMNSLFMEIVKCSPVGLKKTPAEEQENSSILKVDYQSLADDLFQLGSAKQCRRRNRKTVYNLVKKFRDLASDIFPVEEISSGEEDELTPAQIKNAVAKLSKFEMGLVKSNMKMKKKDKKRKRISTKTETETDTDGDNDPPVSESNDHAETKIADEEAAQSTVDQTESRKKTKKSKKRPKEERASFSEANVEEKKSMETETETSQHCDALPFSSGGNDISKAKPAENENTDNPSQAESSKKPKKAKKRSSNDKGINLAEAIIVESPPIKKLKAHHSMDSGMNLTENGCNDSTVNSFSSRLGSNECGTPCKSKASVENKKKKKKKKTEMMNGTLKSPEMTFVETEVPKALVFKTKTNASPLTNDTVVTSDVARKQALKEVKKIGDMKVDTPQSAKKRVIFQMNQNRAQEFNESLNLSPIFPFNPEKKPEQGILKSQSTPLSAPKVKVSVMPRIKTPKIRKPPSTFTPMMIPAPDKKHKRRKTSL